MFAARSTALCSPNGPIDHRHPHAPNMGHLVEHAEHGRLVVFAGAGISMIPPTCLPSWWEVNEVVLRALASRVGELTGEEQARVLASHVVERMRRRKLPPEFQAEPIAQRLKKSYFEVLQRLFIGGFLSLMIRLAPSQLLK